MATEEILMAGVQHGGDRQQLHEAIRRHSIAAAENVKTHGRQNDLMHRLGEDPAFAAVSLKSVLDPSSFTGRAPEQVDQFVAAVVAPIRERYAATLKSSVVLKV